MTKPTFANSSPASSQDEGYSTRTARNSDEALTAIEARRPTMIFLDIWMQGSKLDGLQLLEMRQAPPPDPAGGDDFGPRQHRDGGHRHPPGRL